MASNAIEENRKGKTGMSQTVRYGKVRASQDPDHGDRETRFKGAGVYFGSNFPLSATKEGDVFQRIDVTCRTRTVHGAVVK